MKMPTKSRKSIHSMKDMALKLCRREWKWNVQFTLNKFHVKYERKKSFLKATAINSLFSAAYSDHLWYPSILLYLNLLCFSITNSPEINLVMLTHEENEEIYWVHNVDRIIENFLHMKRFIHKTLRDQRAEEF